MLGTEVIIIDPEREYASLAEAVGGDYINFSTSSPVKINPFDLPTPTKESEGEDELGRKILSLIGFLKLVLGDINPDEVAILDRAINTTYRLKGITKSADYQPGMQLPLMEDLYKVLIGMEDQLSQSLALRLERFIKGSLAGIFSAQSNVQIHNQLTVFSVRDLPEALRPLSMYLILDYIWTKIRFEFKKRVLIVDEAWYMMKYPDSASFLVEIVKRARKYYLGVTTISQDVEDFWGENKGKEIISNSAMQVLFKQAPISIGRIGDTFNLSQGERRLLLSAGVGKGLFFAGNVHVAMRVVASEEEHKLITTKPEEIIST
ncbi:MAG: ATP-binding protein, partial [Candidatus Daviesbacteria bacterium]|nr:ATP-binding protein [Candidatus Daviesbacteria bacterium]